MLRLKAILLSMVVLIILMVGPLYLYQKLTNQDLKDENMTFKEMLLLVVGAGIGAGAARLVHLVVITRGGKISLEEEERIYRGKKL